MISFFQGKDSLYPFPLFSSFPVPREYTPNLTGRSTMKQGEEILLQQYAGLFFFSFIVAVVFLQRFLCVLLLPLVLLYEIWSFGLKDKWLDKMKLKCHHFACSI